MNVPDMLYFTIFYTLTAIFNWKKIDCFKSNEIPLQSNQIAFKNTFWIEKMFKFNGVTSILMGHYGEKMPIFLIY